MNCQACGLPLATYDEHRVSCKNGHVWTLPEHADKPATMGPSIPAKASQRPALKDPLRPYLLTALGLLVVDVALNIVELLS